MIHDTITITKSSYISKNEFKSFFRLALLILILAIIASGFVSMTLALWMLIIL